MESRPEGLVRIKAFPLQYRQFSFIVDETFTLNVEEDTSEDDPNIEEAEAAQGKEDTEDTWSNIFGENNSNSGAADDDSEHELVIDLEEHDYAEPATKDKNVPLSESNVTDSTPFDNNPEAQSVAIATNSYINKYQCASCSFCTYKPKLLLKHNAKHATGFSCATCAFNTHSLSESERHQGNCAGKNTRFRCPHCSATTVRLSSLRKHIRNYHSDDPAFRCPKCPFSTSNRGLMEKHKLKHETASFACALCGFKGESKPDLKKHHLENHPLRCDRCDFMTSTADDLERHAQCHTINYSVMVKCKFCNFRDGSAEIVATHETNHWKKKKRLNGVS